MKNSNLHRSSQFGILVLVASIFMVAGCSESPKRARITPRPPPIPGPGTADGGVSTDVLVSAPDSGSVVDASVEADGGASPMDAQVGVDMGSGQPDATPPADADAGVGIDVRRVTARYDQCNGANTVSIPIRVNDGDNSSTTRNPPMTSFMVPFARGTDMKTLNTLKVVDEQGVQLPAQFEALSRYNAHPDDCSAPIRHAYAHVRAVPSPGNTATWRVVNDPNHPGEATPLDVTETNARWVIDTGVARFTIERQNFTGLPKVELPNASGYATVIDNTRGGFRLENNGARILQAPWYLELERAGPQAVTVAARGYYSSSGSAHGLGYTIRLYFYANSATVRVDHTVYYGDVENFSASGGTNTTGIDSAKMVLPLSAPTTAVTAGMANRSASNAGDALAVRQLKRSPSRRTFRAEITNGTTVVETEPRATSPFLRVTSGNARVMATMNRMAVRDPQGISYQAANNSMVLEFISEPITVGGARGIWGSAAINFASGASDGTSQAQLQLHLERPLLATPGLEHIHATRTIGPYATNQSQHTALFMLLQQLHDNTAQYLDSRNISGLQVWPDVPRFDYQADPNSYFDGGENNYWNWAKPGIDEFFRTGSNRFIYDFSLSQAMLFSETTVFRTYNDNIFASSVAGLAPCYGDSYGWGSDFREGLNSRRDRCPGDYTYNKHLKLAYLATGDRRFVDFFEEAGASAINEFGFPAPAAPMQYVELTYARLSFQRLENVMNAAEFGRDTSMSATARNALSSYVTTMLQGTLLNGHACWVSGSGSNSAIANGNCESPQAWMMPSPLEFTRRAVSFLDHTALRNWLNQYLDVSIRLHTVTNASGHPDLSRTGQWNTCYDCSTNSSGVVESSCRSFNCSNEGFYDNGLLAYLNAFGLLLSSEVSGSASICAWLPGAYLGHLGTLMMFPGEVNNMIWGKASGQAFQMASQAVGALDYYCP